MNAVMEALLNRRSCRAFLQKPIPCEELDAILQAAIYAPSGMGLQTWQFTAVTDRDKINMLAEVVGSVLNREGYDMYRPEVIIIPSNDKDSRFGKEDNACALENIFLAAHSFGIGSVWINQLQGICDEPAVREVLTQLGVPQDHVVYGLAALGYPAKELPQNVTKNGKVVVIKS